MKPILLQFVILLFCTCIFAQDNLEKKKLIADYHEKGIALRYVKKDSAYYYLDQALDFANDLGDYGDALEILIQSIFINGQYSDMRHWQSNLDKMDAMLQIDSMKSNIDYLEYYQNRLIYEKGSYLFELKDYERAKIQFLKAYKSLGEKEISSLDAFDFPILVNTTNFLASIYMYTAKYDLAENYYNQSLVFVDQNEFGKKKGLDRATNRLLSQLYLFTGKHELALGVLEKLLDDYKVLYQKDKKNKNSLVVVYQRLVNNHTLQDSLNKALTYLDESQGYLINEDPFLKDSYLLYGDIYSKLDEYKQALEYYQKSLTIFKEFHQNNSHQDIAKVHGKIAELHFKEKNYQKGLETIQKAFNVAGNKINITDFKQNPNPEEAFSKTQLLHLLDVKLQLLQGNFEETKNLDYQDAALQTSRDILSTFELLKSEFDSKLDKQFLAEKAYPVFHRMLEITYTAYEKDRSLETLQLALNIAEKNKDFLLLEALRSSQASQFGNVPKNVLEKEAQLRAQITKLEKQLFDATESESGFSNALFKRKQEYYGFLDSLKTNYPKYHELKYQNKILDLATVRGKMFDDDGTLISYTMADDYLYTIVVDASKQDFLKLPFDESDRKAVRDFYRILSSPTITDNTSAISESGKLLFEKILKGPLGNFDSENLTIIPDGELHYLPFDLLEENGSYLLETKSIGYGNSVTSLLELKEKESSKTNEMLALAPSFSGAVAVNSDRQFGKLLYNDDEVQKIGTYFDSETVFEKEATLTNFKVNASRFNIFHLATHASANDEYPDYSYLAFTEVNDSAESNILYIKDLYNTSLNADMVTLSACQTGIGKLQKGQGMMSLSKGFFYAGAKSLVNTLWKINDKSTVKLMEYFYEGLSKGYSKSEALRKAKLKYLETTEDNLLRHPYYWSAFVVSGDIAPITRTYFWWYFVLGAALLVLFVAFIYSKRKRKTTLTS